MVRVTVVGGGVLGIKIIGELAYHGHEVRVYDKSPEAYDIIQYHLNEDKKALREDGILVRSTFPGSIHFSEWLEEAVKDSDFIFEAITENLSLKQDLLERISLYSKSDAIIATSTLRIDVNDVTYNTSHKERCLGVRFLFPVYCVPEVEVVPTKLTSVYSLEKVRSFLEGMGKTLFFRTGTEPLILTERQRAERKAAFQILQKPTESSQPSNNSSQMSLEKIDGKNSRGKDCVVCMDKERNCVLNPCRHFCTCTSCGNKLLVRQDSCPICRNRIAAVFQIYYS